MFAVRKYPAVFVMAGLLCVLIAGAAYADTVTVRYEGGNTESQLSPEFIKWQEEGRPVGESGYIPEPLDMTHLYYNPPKLTNDNGGRVAYAAAAAQILARLTNPVEQELYCGIVAQEVGVSPDAVRAQVARVRKARKTAESRQEFQNAVRTASGAGRDAFYPTGTPPVIKKAEEHLLAALIRNPDFCRTLGDALDPQLFFSALNGRICEEILRRTDAGLPVSVHSFADIFTTDEMGHVARIVSANRELGNTVAECQDCLGVIRRAREEASRGDVGSMNDEEYRKLFKKT